MTPAELLRKARETLSKPGTWCQSYFATDADGEPADVHAKEAKCFCVLGAIRLHDPDSVRFVTYPFLMQAIEAMGYQSFFDFNDAPEMSEARVLAAYDDAIARAEMAHAG